MSILILSLIVNIILIARVSAKPRGRHVMVAYSGIHRSVNSDKYSAKHRMNS